MRFSLSRSAKLYLAADPFAHPFERCFDWLSRVLTLNVPHSTQKRVLSLHRAQVAPLNHSGPFNIWMGAVLFSSVHLWPRGNPNRTPPRPESQFFSPGRDGLSHVFWFVFGGFRRRRGPTVGRINWRWSFNDWHVKGGKTPYWWKKATVALPWQLFGFPLGVVGPRHMSSTLCPFLLLPESEGGTYRQLS